ncbi:MAG: GHKL domain-containing protein [Marinilabiliaceae bacterium]|nr:GHKL domain-containing protein [Marinilabiliaceae bacterium]
MFGWFGNSKSVRRLRLMLASIKAGDFSLHFNEQNLRGEERMLVSEINDVVSEFRERSKRIEAQYGYLEALLNKSKSYLIVADDNGVVSWMNESAIKGLCGFKIDRLSTLASLNDSLPRELESLATGQQKLLSLVVNNSLVEWSVTMTKFTRYGVELRMYSMDDVQNVLQQNEVAAQNKLVRVLTHEIMNSLTPIISLSETISQSFDRESPDMDDIQTAVSAIGRRSRGLLSFVESFRQLSRISPPHRQMIRLGELVDGLRQLYQSPIVSFDVRDGDEMLFVDQHQMEQVVINLVKNAIEACQDNPNASVSVLASEDKVNRRFLITVRDNGCGMMPDIVERIFTPFFTTKSSGMGIGLSICRQVVTSHGGRIYVRSSTNEATHGTEFTIELPMVIEVPLN